MYLQNELPLPQTVHVNGKVPVWVITCLFRSHFCMKLLLQSSHSNLPFTYNITIKQVKATSFGRAAFSCSVAQPPFNINFPWSLGYIRKLVFRVPGETISLLVFVQPIHSVPEYQTCTDTAFSGYKFTPWSSGASEIHFLCPKKFMLGQCRIQTRDLLICS